MKPILALLPKEKIIRDIMTLRENVARKKFGNYDQRKDTLPHISLVYSQTSLDQKLLKRLVDDCQNIFTDSQKVDLKISGFQIWDNKISIMFDQKEISEFIKKSVDIYSKFQILDKNINLDEVGDHMKVVREVKEENIDKTINLIKKTLPSSIVFNQIVLIDYNCTLKDIYWKKVLD